MSPTARISPFAIALCLAALAACDRKPAVETEPRSLNEASFQYPEDLWDAGVEGRTVLAIHIDTAGRVDSARVETPSRYPAFDSAALAGTGALRFEPARRDGAAIGKWVLLPVEFEITAPDSAAQAGAPAQGTLTQ